MEWYNYKFKITHDQGSFLLTTPSPSKESAVYSITTAEGCPERALEFITKTPISE